jgi:predicted TIM-barrel fold metal-dependent hydrolase
MRKYALVRRFRAAAEAFPHLPLVLGHGGARDAAEAIALAREHPNLWLGLASLGATQIDEALAALGPERLLFESDWPFYHLAVTLAKVLIVTRESPGARAPILGGNAERLLAEAAKAGRTNVACASNGGD